MLKGIDPLLSGELLDALDSLGHGQTLAVVDRNYPAYRSGAPVIRVDADLVSVVRAILSVLPLDPELARMQVGDDPAIVHPQMRAALALADEADEVEPVPRFEFYERADAAAVVVLTRESEPYGNIVFTKGVVNPPAS